MKHFTLLIAFVALVGGCASISESTFASDPGNPQNVIVEKAIRSYLKKHTGKLIKEDLEKVTGLDLYRTNISDAGLKEVAELLIANGAGVNVKSKFGETPLDLAIGMDRTETADVLRKHGGKTGEELEAEGN